MHENLLEGLRQDLIEGLRLLERYNDPGSWLAVQMCDITTLLDALEAAREDAERIDALEAIVMESDERALLLHHGLHEPRDQGFCGLGLGNTGGSLRAAIDQVRGKGVP